MIVTDVALAASKFPTFARTTGVTEATCTDPPVLPTVSIVTLAVRLPAVEGFVVNDTVNAVGVALEIVPTALSLKLTESPVVVGSKPKPLIIIEPALAARPAVLLVITGVTVATFAFAPLD